MGFVIGVCGLFHGEQFARTHEVIVTVGVGKEAVVADAVQAGREGVQKETAQELAGGDYRDRTRKNVIDSDGSAIIYFGEIEGGTESTLDDCVQLAKPYQLINGAGTQPGQAAKQIAEFVRERGVQTLNIAGPRASKMEKGHKYAFDTVRMLVDFLSQKRPAGKRSSNRSGKQKGNGQAQAGAGNGSERSSKGRNPQFNAQRRKGLGQHYRAKHGVK